MIELISAAKIGKNNNFQIFEQRTQQVPAFLLLSREKIRPMGQMIELLENKIVFKFSCFQFETKGGGYSFKL